MPEALPLILFLFLQIQQQRILLPVITWDVQQRKQ